jgi:CheY-like chemotaxis protein
MPDPLHRVALVLAKADNALLPRLGAALAKQGLGCTTCTQAAQAFIHLARHDTAETGIVVAVILEAMPGLSVSALGTSLRGLPGRGALPLILVDDLARAPARALVLRPPAAAADVARLAAMPPDLWAQSAAGSPTTLPATTTAPAAGVILVVDDHPINRAMMSLQAKGVGLPIEICEDGAAAVARVAAGGVRLVLMDCQMPVMDGYAATRIIRQAESGSTGHLPIIAVTANAMAENRALCHEAGMDDFLTKPVTQEELVRVITRWLVPPLRTASVELESRFQDCLVFDPQPLHQIERIAVGRGRMLASILLADLPPFPAAVQQCIDHDDLAGLGRLAHKLKGSAGSLGAMELHLACSALELAARSQDRNACAQAIPVALEALDRLPPVLTSFIDALPKPSA